MGEPRDCPCAGGAPRSAAGERAGLLVAGHGWMDPALMECSLGIPQRAGGRRHLVDKPPSPWLVPERGVAEQRQAKGA